MKIMRAVSRPKTEMPLQRIPDDRVMSRMGHASTYVVSTPTRATSLKASVMPCAPGEGSISVRTESRGNPAWRDRTAPRAVGLDHGCERRLDEAGGEIGERHSYPR